MHNPFGLLNLQLLHALIGAGNRYFVRQSWQRGLHPFDEIQKAAFLFSHYRDLSSAQQHYKILHYDAHRFLYDSSNPEHYTKLETAARQVPAYPVYTPLLEKPWQPSEKMAVSIRRYIATCLNWHVPREEIVKADLFTEFGELFVNLKYKSQEARVPLADIEKS